MTCQWPCPHPNIGTIKWSCLANFPLIFTVKVTTGDGIYCFVCADFANQLLAWFFQTHQQSLITNLASSIHPCWIFSATRPLFVVLKSSGERLWGSTIKAKGLEFRSHKDVTIFESNHIIKRLKSLRYFSHITNLFLRSFHTNYVTPISMRSGMKLILTKN